MTNGAGLEFLCARQNPHLFQHSYLMLAQKEKMEQPSSPSPEEQDFGRQQQSSLSVVDQKLGGSSEATACAMRSRYLLGSS